ncbi:unnamed protein product [Rotaria socialis]
MYKKSFYSRRVILRRKRRLRKLDYNRNYSISLSSSLSDNGNEAYNVSQYVQNAQAISSNIMTASNEEISAYENYHDDEYDNINELNDFQENVLQQSPSLYHGCRFSTVTTLKMLMDFLISRVSLDKSNIINLMKLIKKILPIPNTLPISWKSIMKLFGKVNLSSTTFICSKYLNECEKTAFNTKNCTNDRCSLCKRTLKTNEIVEVVNLDVRTQLKSIITRNINLMKQNDDIEYLITNGTTFYINNVEYNFVVRTQFFLADLPAKALFLKTTSFNEFRNGISVICPYNKNDLQLRTHSGFIGAAKEAEEETT